MEFIFMRRPGIRPNILRRRPDAIAYRGQKYDLLIFLLPYCAVLVAFGPLRLADEVR